MNPDQHRAHTVVAVLYLANALGLFDRLGVKGGSASETDAEVAIRDRTIDRLSPRNAELEASRSRTPGLEQLVRGAQLQTEVLETGSSAEDVRRPLRTQLRHGYAWAS